MEDIEKLKYPIGRLAIPETVSSELRHQHIQSIKQLPQKLKEVIGIMNEDQLDTPYRPDGWTVRQLIHHIADSHMNAFTRFKLGMTESEPTIRPYDQAAWCNMEDAKQLDPALSMDIISGLHGRWVKVLSDMTAEDFDKNIIHPEMKKKLKMNELLCIYGWHSEHHLAHITGLRDRMNW